MVAQNSGCEMVDGRCIHCHRPDYLQVTDDYKCSGPEGTKNLDGVTVVLYGLKCEECPGAHFHQGADGSWLHCLVDGNYYAVNPATRAPCPLNEVLLLRKHNEVLQTGLREALRLLERAKCENCGGSLAENPPMGRCGNASHSYNAGIIKGLKEILASGQPTTA